MPTATPRKSTTAPRKRRTRKATAKSTPLNTTVESKLNGEPVVTETVKEVKVDVKRRNLTELNGLELVILPLIYLEGFAKFILQETGVLETV
tara:strand:+ start:28 stop:303 length:276 start_codon:yes stop_codon:yes gene_type:complete